LSVAITYSSFGKGIRAYESLDYEQARANARAG